MKVKAKRTFATGSKRVARGEETTLSDAYAKELERRGIVEIVGKETEPKNTNTDSPDNTKPEGPDSRKAVGEDMEHKCGLCGDSFTTQRGLTTHQTAKHK